MRVFNDFYYIHQTFDGKFSIWSIDDQVKMSNDFRTREDALKILAIMPHSVVMEEVIKKEKENTK